MFRCATGQVLTSVQFEASEGYVPGGLQGQGDRTWLEDSGLGVYEVSSAVPAIDAQKVRVDTAPLLNTAWTWQDLSSSSIGSGTPVIVASVRVHISDDSRSASFAGLDCYQVDPQSQLLGLRFRPSAGLDAGEVKMIHGLDYLATGLPAPSINTWHRLRVFVDAGTADGAGEIDGVGVFKTSPISLSSHYVPFVSRYADADLYIEPTGYNVISFDDYSVEAVSRGTLRGRIDLEGWQGVVAGLPATVEIRSESGSTVEILSTTLGADGSYQVVTGYRGNGFVVAKAPHWLAQSTPLLPITKFGIFELDFQLFNGDINGDNSVDIADYAVLSAAYGKNLGEFGYVASADLNGDEAIDIADYSLLSSNYGLSGD